ncbi:DUF389 domain-containing protein [Synechococcus sp. MU1651]|uniref:DUF389 domain-containing protein n=1 Tax=Synechococcus sp. MU1651 TaxID=2508353 RepID=UPI0020263804
MIVDQQSLLEDKDRLEELRRSYDGEARLNESFIVLTVGASLIASLGLVADNNAVIIGAMVVAPWILPLRVTVFAILIGQARLLSRSLITLVAGAGITLILSMALGLIARSQGLLVVEALPEQIVARLEPNTFDLGIALAAGAIATYAKVNPGAVSSMAGTAIAVALVPPVCVMGLMLSGPDISSAQGPALLYAANLLGILIGGITVLAIREPYFRDKLRRRRRSRLPVLLALGLAVVVGQKLYGRYEQYRYRLNREVAQKQIESEIRYYLKNETLTFGANDALKLEKVVFDWPDYWEQNQAPSFLVVVRSLDPKPSYKQVQNIQDTINSRLSGQFPGLELQMQVQRINVSVVEGNEVDLEVDLEQIFNEADTSQAPPQALEDEPKVQAEDSAVAEICSEPDC